MRTKIIYNSWMAKTLLLPGYHTIMLFGLIITKKSKVELTERIRNHESTHVMQFVEVTLLSLFFFIGMAYTLNVWCLPLLSPLIYYLWYLIEYVVRRKGRTRHEAYRNISFEREAYGKEQINNYLKNRPFMEFIKYL